jgi:hypothetical protein
MIKRRTWLMVCLAFLSGGAAYGLEDSGRTEVGKVGVKVYHATNGDPLSAGPKALPVGEEVAGRLRLDPHLRFKSYRLLGADVQPLLRSYESWAEPLKPSDEVLVRFEAQGRPTKDTAVLDLELWLARKKIVKTDARLEAGKPLFMLGPEWRGGRLIIAVALASGK